MHEEEREQSEHSVCGPAGSTPAAAELKKWFSFNKASTIYNLFLSGPFLLLLFSIVKPWSLK